MNKFILVLVMLCAFSIAQPFSNANDESSASYTDGSASTQSISQEDIEKKIEEAKIKARKAKKEIRAKKKVAEKEIKARKKEIQKDVKV